MKYYIQLSPFKANIGSLDHRFIM